MKFEIKNKFSEDVIFSLETKSFKLCVEAAVEAGANLSRADLYRANLSGANLAEANLSGANLYRANLSVANLAEANLSGTDLSGANLAEADLSEANLAGANLSVANLAEANLSGANLAEADLYRADLYRANLAGADLAEANLSVANLAEANGINPYMTTPLFLLKDQIGKIRAYKLVDSEQEGPYQGGIVYKIGKTVSVKNACTDINQQCAPGISLATLDWCIKDWREGYKILIAEFTSKDIAAIPIATDGKFRVSKCKIVGEKNLKEIGLKGR